EKIYAELSAAGVDVIYDDRDDRAGVKFKDADLVGIPIRVVVGKKVSEGEVEVSLRRDPKNSREDVPIDGATKRVLELRELLYREIEEKVEKIK
ncbi:proline--tRNA ligase, partial [bacterium]|nr:proline--tRNA ligase [bacterium]